MTHRQVLLEKQKGAVLKYSPLSFSVRALPVRQTVPRRTALGSDGIAESFFVFVARCYRAVDLDFVFLGLSVGVKLRAGISILCFFRLQLLSSRFLRRYKCTALKVLFLRRYKCTAQFILILRLPDGVKLRAGAFILGVFLCCYLLMNGLLCRLCGVPLWLLSVLHGGGYLYRSIGKIKNLKKNVDVGIVLIHILSLSNKKRQTTGGFLVSPR